MTQNRPDPDGRGNFIPNEDEQIMRFRVDVIVPEDANRGLVRNRVRRKLQGDDVEPFDKVSLRLWSFFR